jgi:hypothetical protein
MIKITTIATGLCAIGLAVVVSACATHEKKITKQVEGMPIDCATAEGDMRMLQEEKKSTTQRIAKGIQMVVPAGIIVGLATRTQRTKYQIASGQYNTMLDNKIAEIKAACPDSIGSDTEE